MYVFYSSIHTKGGHVTHRLLHHHGDEGTPPDWTVVDRPAVFQRQASDVQHSLEHMCR